MLVLTLYPLANPALWFVKYRTVVTAVVNSLTTLNAPEDVTIMPYLPMAVKAELEICDVAITIPVAF